MLSLFSASENEFEAIDSCLSEENAHRDPSGKTDKGAQYSFREFTNKWKKGLYTNNKFIH